MPVFSIWRKRNRAAFQILLAKARELAMRSSLSAMSMPGAAPRSSAKRTASVPYSSITSSGSIVLPFVFDIFCRWASRTSPWMYTVRKGTSPVHSRPSMIMRATQKNRMSNPVISSVVG